MLCWVSPTYVLGKANDLCIGFKKTSLLELAFGIKAAYEDFLSSYWLVTNCIIAQFSLAVSYLRGTRLL